MRALDVITRAFRRLGVVGVDEPVQAHDAASARAVLEGLVREMRTTEGISLPFSMDTIPSRFVEPLALLLAAEIASDYSAQPPVPRVTAIIRLRAASYPLTSSHCDDICDDYGQFCDPCCDTPEPPVIIQQGGAFQYENRAEVAARTVPAEAKVIRVHGRQTAGYGGAWYRRVETSTHPFKLLDMAGAIFEPTGDPAAIGALVPPGEAVTIGENGDFPDLQTAADLLWAYSADRMVELKIISPPKKGWWIRAEGFYRLTSDIGPVVLPSDFQGVSNAFMEGFGANTLASTYISDKNFIVGLGVRAPQIGCVIDMNSPRGSNRLGSGIHIQHGSLYIEGGCGVKNAGLVGVMAQDTDLWGIGAVVENSGCENWRIQQASTVTLQEAAGRNGLVEHGAAGLSTSGSSSFISRASSANLALMEITGSHNDGIELHGVNARMTEMEISGNARHGFVADLHSMGTCYKAVITGNGGYGAALSDGSDFSFRQADLSGNTLESIRLTGGGAVAWLSGATTNHSVSPGVPNWADISGPGTQDVWNVPGQHGIAYLGDDGPIQNMGIKNIGTMSAAGLTNGKRFGSSAVLDSSRSGNTEQTHQRFYNSNGLVGILTTAGYGAGISKAADSRVATATAAVPGNPMDFVTNVQVKRITWPDGSVEYGILAQDLLAVASEAVYGGNGAPGDADFVPKGVDLVKLIPRIILALKAMSA